jgi:guanylate kinase
MIKVIAICGKAGSGKDAILNELAKLSSSFHKIISYTTRPRREGEKEGEDYFYLTNEQFQSAIASGEMLEWTRFNNWNYGSSIEQLDEDKINIGVFNPYGIYNLSKNPNIELSIYKINCSDKTRLLRQLNRENNPDVKEIIRRYHADEEDFLFLANSDVSGIIPIGNENATTSFQTALEIAKRANVIK